MIQVTERFKGLIQRPGRRIYARATITLSDGTVLNITDKEIASKGIKIQDSTSQSNKFTIGTTASQTLTLNLIDTNGRFKETNFMNAIVVPEIGLLTEQRYDGVTVEYIKKGVFVVDDAVRKTKTITLSCFDNMEKFDVKCTSIKFGETYTYLEIVKLLCQQCGVTLSTETFDGNANFTWLNEDQKDLSCRQILGYVAEITGNFARMNNNGELELRWYDMEHPAVELKNVSGIDSFDTVITTYNLRTIEFNSEEFKDDPALTWTYGDGNGTGISISIENNPLAHGQARGQGPFYKLVGMTFRKFNHKGLSNPTIEAGDTAVIYDVYGMAYNTIISNVTYQIDSGSTYSGDSETIKEKIRYVPDR